MLWIIAAVLFVLWIVGAFVLQWGAWVHLLLLVAVVLVLAKVVKAPRFD
jgi:hypothetical protein